MSTILSEQAKADILNHNFFGNDMYKKFKDERIYGEKCVWDKMSQRKLLTFKSTAKTIKTKLEGKLITVIGKCEFSVSPRSLFSFDGKVHPCIDKSKLMHALEDKAQEMEMTVKRKVYQDLI